MLYIEPPAFDLINLLSPFLSSDIVHNNMAPIAATINIQSKGQRLGIGLINNTPDAPVTISSLAHDGLFNLCPLKVGMQVLCINNISLDGMAAHQAIQILKDSEGLVVIVADTPVQQAAVVSAVPDNAAIPAAPSQSSTVSAHRNVRKRGYIILKKTFKYKPSGFQVSTEKSFTFHGPITQDMVDLINQKLKGLRLTQNANRLQFSMDNFGHYHGNMNHNAQKYYEEDFVVIILEAMEELGYYFRFQYDAEAFSMKMTGDSYTAKELFMFHKMEENS